MGDFSSVANKESLELLKSARESLRNGRTLVAIVSADDALEVFLRHMCLTNGCSANSTTTDSWGKVRAFPRWGMLDFIEYLDSRDKLSDNEKSDFYTFHDWRNLAQHHSLEPKESQVRLVVETVERFIRSRSLPSPAITKPKTERPVVFVDGTNMAYLVDRASPKLKSVELVIERAKRGGYSPKTIVSAALRHRIDEPDRLDELVSRNEIRQAPPGTRTDEYILMEADRARAKVISNKRYAAFEAEYPWVRDQSRLIRVYPSYDDTEVYFSEKAVPPSPGGRRDVPEAPETACRRCGRLVPPRASYCRYCGARLTF